MPTPSSNIVAAHGHLADAMDLLGDAVTGADPATLDDLLYISRLLSAVQDRLSETSRRLAGQCRDIARRA